jgi:hypothetical protein
MLNSDITRRDHAEQITVCRIDMVGEHIVIVGEIMAWGSLLPVSIPAQLVERCRIR